MLTMAYVRAAPDKNEQSPMASLVRRCLPGVALALASCITFADCSSPLPLTGALKIETCDAGKEVCVSAEEAVYEYMKDAEGSPDAYTVGVNSSPWRLYDADMRIITTAEMASLLRPGLTKDKKSVELIASWTGVAAAPNKKSLAQQLSDQLNGFPVTGKDGFLWITKDGKLRTTHQAFSVHAGAGPYQVAKGSEVFVPLATGWYAEMESAFVKEQSADGLLRAGAGWDVYLLCPDRALQTFEAAARLGNPIAAYNAALMHLERGSRTDRKAARSLLMQAASSGDSKAKLRLQMLQGDSK